MMMHSSRLFLGGIFFIAGVNGYFVILGLDPFIATSPEAMALFDFKYLLITEKSLEIICGILLIINRYVPLSLAILTPIITNIFLLHLFLDHTLLLLAVLLVVFDSFLLYYFKDNFRRIFEKKPSEK